MKKINKSNFLLSCKPVLCVCNFFKLFFKVGCVGYLILKL